MSSLATKKGKKGKKGQVGRIPASLDPVGQATPSVRPPLQEIPSTENTNQSNVADVVDITKHQENEEPAKSVSPSAVSISSTEDFQRVRRNPQAALGFKGNTDGWKFFRADVKRLMGNARVSYKLQYSQQPTSVISKIIRVVQIRYPKFATEDYEYYIREVIKQIVQEKRRYMFKAEVKRARELHLIPMTQSRGRPPKVDALQKRLHAEKVRQWGSGGVEGPEDLARMLAEEDEMLRREAEELEQDREDEEE